MGLVVGSYLLKTDISKYRVLEVLLTDGTICQVQEDEATLELLA